MAAFSFCLGFLSAASAGVGSAQIINNANGAGFVSGVTYAYQLRCSNGTTGTNGATTISQDYDLVSGNSVTKANIPEGMVCDVYLMDGRPALQPFHIYDPAPTLDAAGGNTQTACPVPSGALLCQRATIIQSLTNSYLGTQKARLLSVSLTSNLNPAIVIMPVTLTATMNVGGATGTINFRIAGGGVSLPGCGAVALSAGVATCTVSSSNAVTLNIEAAYVPGNYPAETSAPLAQVFKLCDLDIDASGSVRANTDGLVILRRMLGMSGASLIASGIEPAPTAKRTDSAAIAAWIDAHTFPGNRQLDLDGNGTAEAKTDGVMLLRALLGFTGTAVTQGALGTGTLGRGDWPAIRSHLNTTCNLGPAN